MSSVKKIVVLTLIALFGCSSMAVCKQKEEPVSIAPAGILILAEEDQAPADIDQNGHYGQPDDNAGAADPQDINDQSGQEEYHHDSTDSQPVEADPSQQ